MKEIPGDRRGGYLYTLYAFNPWTGEFIEKQEMMARGTWEYIKDYVPFEPLRK